MSISGGCERETVRAGTRIKRHNYGERNSTMTTCCQAPTHLSEEAQSWWQFVHDTHEMSPTDLHVLGHAAEMLDRITAARELIDEDGPIVTDRFGQRREHPAVRVERESKKLYATLVATLQLEHRVRVNRQDSASECNHRKAG